MGAWGASFGVRAGGVLMHGEVWGAVGAEALGGAWGPGPGGGVEQLLPEPRVLQDPRWGAALEEPQPGVVTKACWVCVGRPWPSGEGESGPCCPQVGWGLRVGVGGLGAGHWRLPLSPCLPACPAPQINPPRAPRRGSSRAVTGVSIHAAFWWSCMILHTARACLRLRGCPRMAFGFLSLTRTISV